jgi:PAS domain S-box-containing protein
VPERFRGEHLSQRDGYFASPRIRRMGEGRELFGRHKDGHEIPVEISLSPLETEEGTLVTAAIRDMTERKQAQKELEKERARYRTLVEGIPAVTFMAALDEDARELYVSPQIEALLGFSQKAWLEDPVLWYRQLHPDDRERWHAEFARTCSTGEHFRAEYRFLARNGNVVWVQGEAKVVRGDDGRPMFLQGVAFDITQRKQAEEELRANKENLEQLVAQRTAVLQEQALKLKNYGTFVAHELRKPLNRMIDEAADRLKSAAARRSGQTRELSTWVVDKSREMLVMIDRMLKWARVADREEKRLVPNDCTAVFGTARNLLKDKIAEYGAQVSCSPLPTVLAGQPDRDEWPELVILFENLIGNALKYRAPDRPPRVRAEAQARGDEWLFSVQDNGIGIEPQYYDRIFELFKRLHPEHRIPGHGIGLAYCKRVVESLGGRMWVESEFGKGSTFYFTLPALPGAKPRGGPADRLPAPPEPEAVLPAIKAPNRSSPRKKRGSRAKSASGTRRKHSRGRRRGH